MKFALISDNHDTLTGMRLAGIDGVIVHDRESAEKAIKSFADDADVGILMITERLVSLAPDIIYDMKLNRSRPLIVEIPDRHADGRSKDSIMRYVREAIGVNI